MEGAERAEHPVDHQGCNVQAEHGRHIQIPQDAMELASLGDAEDDHPQDEGDHPESNVTITEKPHRNHSPFAERHVPQPAHAGETREARDNANR
jgi:hypothetical protein